MQINIIIQLFLIIAFLIIVVITSKIYFKITKSGSILKDSLYMAFITTILLHIPLYLNLESRLYWFDNTATIFVIYLWSILILSVIFCIIIYMYKIKDNIIEKSISTLLFVPTIEQCKYRIIECIEPGTSYTIHEIARTIHLPEYQVFRALNILAKENKARLAINSNAEFIYYLF